MTDDDIFGIVIPIDQPLPRAGVKLPCSKSDIEYSEDLLSVMCGNGHGDPDAAWNNPYTIWGFLWGASTCIYDYAQLEDLTFLMELVTTKLEIELNKKRRKHEVTGWY